MYRRHFESWLIFGLSDGFGPNPAVFLARQDDESDLDFAQSSSAAVQYGQQWKLRTPAQQATLEEVAKSYLRRALA